MSVGRRWLGNSLEILIRQHCRLHTNRILLRTTVPQGAAVQPGCASVAALPGQGVLQAAQYLQPHERPCPHRAIVQAPHAADEQHVSNLPRTHTHCEPMGWHGSVMTVLYQNLSDYNQAIQHHRSGLQRKRHLCRMPESMPQRRTPGGAATG